MKTTIKKSWTMECAHKLTCVPEGHKCSYLHGHTYTVTVQLSGEMPSDRPWLVDFADVKDCIHSKFDHRYINDVLEQNGWDDIESTAENLAHVFSDMISIEVLGKEMSWITIDYVTVQEGLGGTATCA